MFAYLDPAMQIMYFHTAVSDFILNLQPFLSQSNLQLLP